MFEYNARTEPINGVQFIEKDIIMFDYLYTGDVFLQCGALLKNSGFGFIIAEYENRPIEQSTNMYLVKFHDDDSYQVLSKVGTQQQTIIDQFIWSATHIYEEEEVYLFFRKTQNRLTVTKAVPEGNGHYREITLMEYTMAYDMDKYKIGIYSNSGNSIRMLAIQTEAPSNWVTNVFNANGGRIQWIPRGFTIEQSEYDIEVETQNIILEPGKYYISYETDNPNMQCYVYESYRRNPDVKRSMEEILETKDDDAKQILENNSFILKEKHAVNMKFKGKWGTVKNIAIKLHEFDDFVETDYESVHREPSCIKFDLNKIAHIKLRGIVTKVPDQDPSEDPTYYIFQRGENTVQLDTDIKLNNEYVYEFTTNNGQLKINGREYKTLSDQAKELRAFYNVTGEIYELILTFKDGHVVNVLIQQTTKTILSNEIDSPVIVLNEEEEPMDLSSSYRLITTIEKRYELFHSYNPIKLTYRPDITNAAIKVYGIKPGVYINTKGENIQQIAESYTDIPYTSKKYDLLHGTIKLDDSIKQFYKWIIIEYNAITETKYWFTNREREIYDMQDNVLIYLNQTPLDMTEGFDIYGVLKDEDINLDLLYYVPDVAAENLIDMSCYQYDRIPRRSEDGTEQYKLTEKGRLIVTDDIINKYRYIIIDYLKKNSYAINKTKNGLEVDIASFDNEYSVLYDSVDGRVTNKYSIIPISQLKKSENNAIEGNEIIEAEIAENDFIVLETEA